MSLAAGLALVPVAAVAQSAVGESAPRACKADPLGPDCRRCWREQGARHPKGMVSFICGKPGFDPAPLVDLDDPDMVDGEDGSPTATAEPTPPIDPRPPIPVTEPIPEPEPKPVVPAPDPDPAPIVTVVTPVPGPVPIPIPTPTPVIEEPPLGRDVSEAMQILQCDDFVDAFNAAQTVTEPTDAFERAYGACQAPALNVFAITRDPRVDGPSAFAPVERVRALTDDMSAMFDAAEDDSVPICERGIPSYETPEDTADLMERITASRAEVGDFLACSEWFEKVATCVFGVGESDDDPAALSLTTYSEWTEEWDTTNRAFTTGTEQLDRTRRLLLARRGASAC